MTTAHELGPLAALVGVWEGASGEDTAPSADRGTRVSKYRERLTFTPTGRVDNREQVLSGLRYATTAWRVGEPDPYHEEVGYWMWDAANQQVLRSFVIPRGMTVLAGGSATADAKQFTLAADVGSPVWGISSNPFLDREFRTVRYTLTVRLVEDGVFEYDEDTILRVKGRPEPFHHTDKHRLRRVSTG
jgi:hypothetical protein